MECFNCKNNKSPCFYSPRELSKYNIYFCSKCLKLIKNIDMSYYSNKDITLKELELICKGNLKWK